MTIAEVKKGHILGPEKIIKSFMAVRLSAVNNEKWVFKSYHHVTYDYSFMMAVCVFQTGVHNNMLLSVAI